MALILVTGASTGLGLAPARALADEGHDVVVVLHARNRGRMDDGAEAGDAGRRHRRPRGH